MKKTKTILLLILVLTMIGMPLVYASYDSTKAVAMSVGTDYSGTWPWESDIDTTQDAIDAQAAFANMGFNSYYQSIPTYQYLRGNNPYTGSPRMESRILFFSGHGNYQSVTYDYKKYSGDYKTGVFWYYNYDSPTSGYKYAGIYSYNMNKVKLAIFGACQTAFGTDNIAKRANTAGAGTTLGWSVSIGSTSHSQWFNNFFTKLKQSGRTVQSAVDYANSFSYSDNGVKNVIVYGDTTYVPTWNTSSSTSSNNPSQSDRGNTTNILLSDISNINSNKTIIEDYIKENMNKDFKIDDYSLEINGEGNRKYYDLKLLVNGAKTNSAYTIVIENNTIVEIIDNTIESFDWKNVKENTISKEEQSRIANEIKEKVEKNDNYKVMSQKIETIYDIDYSEYKTLILTEVKEKSTNTLFVMEDLL